MNISREEDRELTDMIITAMYAYHCSETGVEFKKQDAIDEYLGRWKPGQELHYPLLKNFTDSLKGQIYMYIESKVKE